MGAAANRKKRPHVLAVPLPLQGHVTPLMKLCRQISSHGVKVTFVNTGYIHDQILAATHDNDNDNDNNLVLTSIPDGLSPDDDRKDVGKVVGSLESTMAASLTDLIQKINESCDGDEKISCVIADLSVYWVLEVAERFGAEAVGYVPVSAAAMALALHIPDLVQQGYLRQNGRSLKESDVISLSDNIPPWRRDEFAWSSPVGPTTQRLFDWFQSVAKITNRLKWLLCNTSHELEPSACNLIPKLLPIGPFLETTNYSSLRRQDTSCISWLDGKPAASVIYVSFGSLAVLSQAQLDELALGLEISGRPFLWVVRPDLANGLRVKYPNGFLDRLSSGKIVEWAPQEKVLSHPSVACFVSHCGWNSTLEGLINAVPFLCWAYEVDQFHNQNYICDTWRNGLRIEAGENGIRTRREIKNKIDMLFRDYDNVKARAVALKEMAAASVGQGGSSYNNFKKFIDNLKK